MQVKNVLTILSLTIALAVSGCTTGDNASGGSSNPSLTQTSYATTSNSSGQAVVVVDVPAGATSFQVMAASSSGTLQVTNLVGPNGASVFAINSPTYSGGLGVQLSPVTVMVPVNGGTAQSGKYTLSLTTMNSYGNQASGGAAVTVDVISKSDSDPSSGNLRVNMILVGPVVNDQDLRSGLEDAVQIWKNNFEKANIKLDIEWYDFAGDATVPAPGSPVYATITSAVRPNAVNVINGSYVQGLSAPDFTFGIPGAIGGGALSSTRDVVVFSIIAATGTDGRWNYTDQNRRNNSGYTQTSDDEIRVAGEELGQLAAHYLGLFHNVELSGSQVTQSDYLPDTPTCATYTDCQLSGDANGNIMFPFPLNKLRGRDQVYTINQKYPRNRVTQSQAVVMNSHVLVD